MKRVINISAVLGLVHLLMQLLVLIIKLSKRVNEFALLEKLSPLIESTYFIVMLWVTGVVFLLLLIWVIWSFLFIRLLKNRYNKFKVEKVEKQFKISYQLLFSNLHKAQYLLIKAILYNYHGQPEKAFLELEKCRLKKGKLKDRIDFERARSYFDSGAKKKADSILVELEDKEKSDYKVNYLRALFKEEDGDLEEARSILLEELNSSTKINASTYINLGRLYKIYEETLSLAFYYYNKAVELADKEKDILSLHIAYQNLTNIALLLENENANEYIEQYKSNIDLKDKHNFLEFYNYQLMFARQINNEKFIREAIDKIDEVDFFKVDEVRRFNLLVSTFRIRFNHDYKWIQILDNKLSCINDITGIGLKEKVEAYKLIYWVIQQIKINYPVLAPAYRELNNNTIDFFINSKKEIEQKFLNASPYAIHEIVYWKDVLAYTKEGTKSVEGRWGDLKYVIEVYDEIIDILSSNGNHMAVLDRRVLKADEIMSFMKKYQGKIDSRKWQHLDNLLIKEMDIIKSQIQQFNNHPIVPKIYLQLASIAIDARDDEARHCLEMFNKTNISIKHFDVYLQKSYERAMKKLNLN